MFEFQPVGQKEAIERWNILAMGCKEQITIAHNPSLYHFYREFLSLKPYYFFLYVKSKPIGILPLVNINNAFVSMPHFSGGGFLWMKTVENHISDSDLVLQVSADIRDKKLSPGFYRIDLISETLGKTDYPIIEIRGTKPLFDQKETNKTSFFLQLLRDKEAQFQLFKPNLRRKISKVKKNKIRVESGKFELLDDFTHIYNRNMHRIGSPTLGKNFFKALLKNVEESVLFVAYLSNKPIGGSFVMWYDGYVENTWFSTLEDYNQLYTSYALHWETIIWAIQNNAHTYSMGRSTIGSGTYDYKIQWPVKEKLLYFNRNITKKSRLKDQQWANRVWKKIPVFVVDFVGPIIAKRIY